MPDVLPASDTTYAERASRAVKRLHRLRTVALAMGAIMVGTVLYRHGAPASVWVLLAMHALVWPHVAWQILRRSPNPIAMDLKCFMGDTAMGGVWIALMQFNLLPSALMATMFAITLITIDGKRLLVRGMALQALACVVAAVANGMSFAPETDIVEIFASLPLLVVFPVALGFIMHGLAQRVRAQNRLLLKISSIDSLCGLLNRRHWEDAVSAALARHCCDNAVMLLIDIDGFKSVNDRYGHTAGDEVIRQVGAIIRGSLREGDLAGRYGGDEFSVVLCGAGLPAATTVAERIRAGVACSLFESVPGLRCTVSIGLACAPSDGCAVRDWVKEADAALYRAKLAGRNRFVIVA